MVHHTESPIDFSKSPTNLVDTYTANPPQEINRDNFMAWVTQTFLVGRNSVDLQLLYTAWTSAQHQNFDYVQVMQNFVEHGGWNGISQKEKDVFTIPFRRVRRHSEKMGERPDNEIGFALENNLQDIFTSHEEITTVLSVTTRGLIDAGILASLPPGHTQAFWKIQDGLAAVSPEQFNEFTKKKYPPAQRAK